MDRKLPARFNEMYDMTLLSEVVALNPFPKPQLWHQVASSVSDDNFVIDSRRARERTNLLINKFKRETNEALKQSGVDEDYDEKTILLQEVVDLMSEATRQTLKSKEKEKSDEATAKQMRKRALEGMKKYDEESKEKTPKKMKALTFLQAKQEADLSMRQQELELQKNELNLQRQRFELEKEERRAALEAQKKQTDMLMMLLTKNI